jgi:hypothetical protein
MKTLLLLILSFNVYADFTLNNNISAGFSHDKVKVYFTSNSTCLFADITQAGMLMLIDDAINDYWNKVPTSRLNLQNGGIYQTTNSNYLDGELCNPTLDTCGATTVPQANDIIISCNDDMVKNFPMVSGNPSSKVAIALPNNISGGGIAGSVIVINDTSDAPFRDLDYASRVAVIAHEIGHAFGLGHSGEASSLMYWRVQDIRHSLGPDDVKGITYLYPKRVDGCGLLTTKQNAPPETGHFILNLILGFLLILGARKLSKTYVPVKNG